MNIYLSTGILNILCKYWCSKKY